MTTSAVAPATRGNDATRKRILQAAMELFGRDGFDATTVRAIALRCNLTDPALYYYFETKRDILTALWDLPSPLEQMRAAVPERKLDEATLMELVDWMLNGAARQDALNRILMRSVLNGDATALALRETKRAHWHRILTPYFLTVFFPDEAAVRVEASIMLSLGYIYIAQMEHVNDFPQVAAEPAFRERIRQLMCLAIPIPRAEGN